MGRRLRTRRFRPEQVSGVRGLGRGRRSPGQHLGAGPSARQSPGPARWQRDGPCGARARARMKTPRAWAAGTTGSQGRGPAVSEGAV